jgi:hypothetical protein
MILKNLKIRCINLDRSTDRWNDVSRAFDNELIRIPAIDGMRWSDGTYDDQGRPKWGNIPSNVLTEHFRYFQMFPTAYGCNRSHLRAISDFLTSGDEWGIIIEDDTEPIGDVRAIEVPDDADWFYLLGTDHKGCRVSTWEDGQVRLPRTLAAYALSRRCAVMARLSMNPHHVFQTDWQIPFRCFESLRDNEISKPDWPELPYRVKAYAPQQSIVKQSHHASVSTFTFHGDKPWIPRSMLV